MLAIKSYFLKLKSGEPEKHALSKSEWNQVIDLKSTEYSEHLPSNIYKIIKLYSIQYT